MINTLFIVSTSICAIANISPIIMKYVIAWIFAENKNEYDLKSELVKLENEMSLISMVDEFSKYTKLQRKHTKLKETHKNQVSARISSRAKAQLQFTYLAKILNAIIMMLLLKMYRTQPILILPKGTLWPLNDILSWPGSQEDSISLLIWIGVTSLVIPRLLIKVNSM